MALADGTTALDVDGLPQTQPDPAPRGYGPVSGLLFALGGSLMLWGALLQIGRWLATTLS